ncbi:MAG: 50S ribosomal protein L29 [Vicingaceae bacterium]
MKQEDIKGLSTSDLLEKLAEQEEVLMKLKLNHAIAPLENPLQIRTVRKLIARIHTELRKRELEEVNN